MFNFITIKYTISNNQSITANISINTSTNSKRFTAKGVTSISKDVEINKGLWDIAERIASIKDPDYQIAA